MARAAAGGPGEIIPGEEPVPLNPGRDRVVVVVTNTADRPVQVGSHFHFAAVNPGLEFDRAAAWGRHLDIPAGTSVRFEPGIEREVVLVPLAGARRVPGLRPEYAGTLDERGSEPQVPPTESPPHTSTAQLPAGRTGEPPEYADTRGGPPAHPAESRIRRSTQRTPGGGHQ
jgi:urease subunit beta